jgi:glyoxylase-like metal-dependent hydrolase (beta-lactamase superfamily II)
MSSTQFGDVSVTRVFEWQGHLITRENLVPESTREDWQDNSSWLVPEFWSPDGDDAWLCAASFVVRSAGKTIVIDTAIGNDKQRAAIPPFSGLQTDFLDRLAAAGAKADEVDLVVNTHLHADHVGWNTQLEGDQWVPTFPNARYLLPKLDFDFWNPRGSGDAAAGETSLEDVFADSVLPVVDAGLADFWEGTFEIDENLLLVSAPGHTPGAAVLELSSGDDRAVFTGDLLHTPMQILRPTQSSCFDTDPAQAALTRSRVLGQVADSGAALIATHFGVDRVPRLARSGSEFRIDSWTQLT